MSAVNEALVRRYVEEVYDQRRLEVADEIFASDFTLHDPDLPGGARGPEEMKRVVQTFVDAFPDLQGYTSRRADGHSTLWKPVGGHGSRHLASGRWQDRRSVGGV